MSYSNIPAGKDAPNDIYVIIEIPANAAPIKMKSIKILMRFCRSFHGYSNVLPSELWLCTKYIV